MMIARVMNIASLRVAFNSSHRLSYFIWTRIRIQKQKPYRVVQIG